MPTYFQKPENALKRANEFIEVDKKESALEVLNDVLRSRKHRGKWTATHECIMLLFTKLCIDLHRSSYAKDGLYQYRNICKETNPSSFEKVVKKFLIQAEKKASDAREKSEQAVLQDVDDLDCIVTPESLLLSTVSGEGAKERSDRALLSPWVKFLWESYRNMLELLKNNNTVQTVYASVAKEAFKFCLNFQRRTEFRKLCDTLHNHLSQAQKYQNQLYSLKFDHPETIQCLVDVRFEQLESSIKIDLWQEAFKAIEEIHNLLGISGKAPKPALLENFYLKQAKVYWMARNKLFHAAALHKLFVLRKEQKKTFTQDEAQETASQVLLSTLSIPIEPVPSVADRFLEVDDNILDKSRRLSALLRLNTPPTRASLMKELLSYGVLEHASLDMQQLYKYLEVEYNPLLLSKRVMPILERLKEVKGVSQYVDSLQDITLVRLIKQVAQVYDSIEIDRLAELAPFTTVTNLEKVVVETASTNNIQVRIDHATRCFSFGQDVSFSHRDETPEGPFVQSMPSKNLCSQLTFMSQALQQAVRIIAQKDIETEQMVNAKKASQDYLGHFRGDHRQALQRKNLIESRKEFIEYRNKEKEQVEVTERKQREKRERDAEQLRLEREAKERETQRKESELKELKRKQVEDRLEQLKKTPVGARALAEIKPEDLKEMDADDIFSKQLKQMEKEKREKESKLRAQEKKVDYFERAKRLLEIPLLKQQYEEKRGNDKKFHDEYETDMIAQAIAERKEAESCNARVSVMREDEMKFKEELKQRRHAVFQEKLVVFEEALKKAREEKLQHRKIERKERRRAEAILMAKAEEEKIARLRAEKEREALEERQKEREAELEAQRLKQMQREKEVEEKIKERERKYEADRLSKQDETEERQPRRVDDWRRKSPEPAEEESRYPPKRQGRGEEDRYPPKRQESGEEDRYPPKRQERGEEDRYPPKRQESSEEDRYPPKRQERGEDDRYPPKRQERGEEDRYPPKRQERGGSSYRPPHVRNVEGETSSWRTRDVASDRDAYNSPRGTRRGDSDRDYDQDDRRGPRGFERDDRRGPRDFDRGDRGPRDFDRGPRDFDRDDRRGPRDIDQDRRVARDDGRNETWRSSEGRARHGFDEDSEWRPLRKDYNDDRPRRPAGDDRSWRRDDPRDDDRDRRGPPASRRGREPDEGDRRDGWREGKDRDERSWKDQDVRPSRDVDKRRDHSPRDMERQTNQSPVRKLANDDGFEVVSRRR